MFSNRYTRLLFLLKKQKFKNTVMMMYVTTCKHSYRPIV